MELFPFFGGLDKLAPARRVLDLAGNDDRQPFEEDGFLPCISIMQSAGFVFIIGQSQLAIRSRSFLTQTRTRVGRFGLFGPTEGRVFHSQWPPVRSLALATDAVVSAASAAAKTKIVFMSKILD